MIAAVKPYMTEYRVVLAGAPGIDADYYDTFIKGSGVEVVYNETYPLLSKAHAALVTSGTATLETALFRVPQVVCYKLPLPKIAPYVRKRLIKVKYISLGNLILDRLAFRELWQDGFTAPRLMEEVSRLTEDEPYRSRMQADYAEIRSLLGGSGASEAVARAMIESLRK